MNDKLIKFFDDTFEDTIFDYDHFDSVMPYADD